MFPAYRNILPEPEIPAGDYPVNPLFTIRNTGTIILVGFFLLFCNCISTGQINGRVIKSLNEGWEFTEQSFAESGDAPAKGWEKVSIPHTWNNKDAQSGNGFFAGTAWYRKTVYLDNSIRGKRVFIRFEGVGQVAYVYINGYYAGNHKGSYSAFCFEITDLVDPGEDNTIYVKVNNEARPDVIPVNNSLFTIFGGIYRPVSLVFTNPLNITLTDYASPGVYIRQKTATETNAEIVVTTKLENRSGRKKKVELWTTVFDQTGIFVTREIVNVDIDTSGMIPITQELNFGMPGLWKGRKYPFLYKVITEIKDNGKVIDAVTQPLGLRTYAIDPEKGFILNVKEYRLYGVCRHQEWQDCGNALSNGQQRQDMELICEMGAGAVRLAHYQQSDYIYSLCDTLGLVAWAEIPFVNDWSGDESGNVKQQLTELIRQNYNHPSIVFWGLHNEVHNKSGNDYPTILTKELNELAKKEDPGRYTVCASNVWFLPEDPIHFIADYQGFNQYTGWYGGKPGEIGKWILRMHKDYPGQPFAVSGYGAEGNPYQQSDSIETQPDPLGPFFPENYQTKYHETVWSILESYPYIWATFVGNMFDYTCPDRDRGGVKGRNQNGLITYDRNLKKDAFYWYKANWSDKPVIYITGRRNLSRIGLMQDITVYCNVSEPMLEVNGRIIEGRKSGGTEVHFLWENVELKQGRNLVRSFAVKRGQMIQDSIGIDVK